MSLIKETHSMHKIRMRAFTNNNCAKSLPRTVPQFRFTYLSNCSPANDERLPSNSTGSSPPVLLHLKRREVAFRSPRNTSVGACVKADNDGCIRPMMKSGWRLKRLIASCSAVVVYPSIDVSKHSPRPFPMSPCLSREYKQGRLFVRAGLPV